MGNNLQCYSQRGRNMSSSVGFFKPWMSVNSSKSLRLSKVNMTFEEQRSNIEFWRYLEKSLTETLHMLQKMYSNKPIGLAQIFSKNDVSIVHLRLRKLRCPQLRLSRPKAPKNVFSNWRASKSPTFWTPIFMYRKCSFI